jgi:hypothetical protein
MKTIIDTKYPDIVKKTLEDLKNKENTILQKNLKLWIPESIQTKSFQADGENKLPSSNIQYLWWIFLVKPSIDIAKEIMRNVKHTPRKLLEKIYKKTFDNNRICNHDTNNKYINHEYNQWVAFSTLHDLTYTRRISFDERKAWIKRIFPSANEEEITAFVFHRRAFNKKIWNIIENRLKLNIPAAIPFLFPEKIDKKNILYHNPLNEFYFDKIITQIQAHLVNTNGILTLIIDGLLTSNEISIRQLFLLSYILLLLEKLTCIREIILLDQALFPEEELVLFPFIELYTKALHEQTKARVIVKFNEIPIYKTENKELSLQNLFATHYTYSQDSIEGQQLEAIMYINSFRDIHRVELSAITNAYLFTVNKKAFYYANFMKKNFSKKSYKCVFLNTIQYNRQVQWVEQQII